MNKNKPARSISSMEALMALPRKFYHLGTNAGWIVHLALLLGMVATATDVVAHNDWEVSFSAERANIKNACIAQLYGDTPISDSADPNNTDPTKTNSYVNTCNKCHNINPPPPPPPREGAIVTAIGKAICKFEGKDNTTRCPDVPGEPDDVPPSTALTDTDYAAMCITPPITVRVVVSGNGSVTGTGINCSGDCSVLFAQSATPVTLTATPASALFVFNNWSGGTCGGSTSTTCSVQKTANTTETANFTAAPTSTLNVDFLGGGSGNVTAGGIDCPSGGGGDCTEEYVTANNTSVTLTATASAGSAFTGWSGACTNKTGPCTVMMSADRSVTATFKPTFTLSVSSGQGGTVTSSPSGINCGGDCSEAFVDGTPVTLTAASAEGYVFSGWSGDCTGSSSTCTLTMSADHSVTATFTPKLFVSTRGLGKITSGPAGIDCGIDCGETYPAGTQVTLTATPAPGYVFDRWSGACAGKGVCVVTLLDANTVTAIFRNRDKRAIADGRRFLLFPNPQVQPDGKFQTDTLEYAEAYYRAIDPNNDKDTLQKWKAANHFGAGGDGQACGVVGQACEVNVIFGDQHDLGTGRRMTGRQNVDGTIAFMVDTFLVDLGAGYTFSPNNVLAAVQGARRRAEGTSAIEYSPGPNPGDNVNFAKFYFFDPVTGERRLAVDLDGRGKKAMPGLCIACHGGRADPLTPSFDSPTGRALFPLINNTSSQQRGDTQAQLHPLKVDTFDYAEIAGFTREDQEAKLKELNKLVLCAYPRAENSEFPEDLCRPVSGTDTSRSEWMGGAANWIKGAYGGNGLPNGTYVDAYMPDTWLTYGQSTLYRKAVNSACLGCHMLRGTGNQDDIDFTDVLHFMEYADGIKKHVIDRGNMPLAKLISERFRLRGARSMAAKLAVFLERRGQTVRKRVGGLLQPGRPIAYPGPDRVIQDSAVLSASESLYANTYKWKLVSAPAGAEYTLHRPRSANPTFSATTDGIYTLRLVASDRGRRRDAAKFKIVVDHTLSPAPAIIRFSDIKPILADCVRCHQKPQDQNPNGEHFLLNDKNPPISFTAEDDRNEDGITDDPTDDLWFYTEVRGRINFTDIEASPLLRKPSGHHHFQSDTETTLPTGFNTTTGLPGAGTRANYDIILNWILNGAPYE